MKKRMALFLSLVLLLSMTAAGCNKKVEPESAADLLKITENAENNNFSLVGEINMNMGMEAMGLTFDIPVNMAMNMDVADQNVHGTLNLTMDMGALGGENKLTSELYVQKEGEETIVYSKSNDESQWSKSDAESQQVVSVGTDLLESANFDSADFKHDETAKTYVVTQKFADMISDGEMEEYFTSLFDSLGALGIGEDEVKEFMDGMGDSEVIYTFDDEECRLQSVKMDNMDYSLDTDIGGTKMTIKVSMGIDYNYSNYGQIKAEDVAVPDDVKAEAE